MVDLCKRKERIQKFRFGPVTGRVGNLNDIQQHDGVVVRCSVLDPSLNDAPIVEMNPDEAARSRLIIRGPLRLGGWVRADHGLFSLGARA
jgi:hypothetical protein